MNKSELNKILVPVDFSETSETATSNAIIIAKLLNAEIFLLCVIEDNWRHFAKIVEIQTVPATLLDIEKAVEKRMLEMQKKISLKLDIQPKINIVSGNVSSEIISFSEKEKIGLIIMGTHGASSYNEMFIGSTAQHVISLSKVPVLTMQKNCNKSDYKNILIPIDDSMHSREKVNIAIIMGSLFGSTIHIVGLFNSEDEHKLNKFNTKIKSVEEIIDESGLQRTTTLVHGKHLAKVALDYGLKNKCDLIVINTGHESEISEIFMGAFSEHIANHSKIPVLTIRHTPTHYRVDAPGMTNF